MTLRTPRPVLIRVGDAWVSGIIVKAFRDGSGAWVARVTWKNPMPPPYETFTETRPYGDLRPSPE
jgi:hypothetical protein